MKLKKTKFKNGLDRGNYSYSPIADLIALCVTSE